MAVFARKNQGIRLGIGISDAIKLNDMLSEAIRTPLHIILDGRKWAFKKGRSFLLTAQSFSLTVGLCWLRSIGLVFFTYG